MYFVHPKNSIKFGFFYQEPDDKKTVEWLMMRQLFLRYIGTGVGLVLVLLVVTVVLHTLLIYGLSGNMSLVT